MGQKLKTGLQGPDLQISCNQACLLPKTQWSMKNRESAPKPEVSPHHWGRLTTVLPLHSKVSLKQEKRWGKLWQGSFWTKTEFIKAGIREAKQTTFTGTISVSNSSTFRPGGSAKVYNLGSGHHPLRPLYSVVNLCDVLQPCFLDRGRQHGGTLKCWVWKMEKSRGWGDHESKHKLQAFLFFCLEGILIKV